jgi:hypothetical protein
MGSLIDTLKRIVEKQRMERAQVRRDEKGEINEETLISSFASFVSSPPPQTAAGRAPEVSSFTPFVSSPRTPETAADWRAEYQERAVAYGLHRPRADAQRMAWHHVAALWYRHHGKRTAAGRLCAGCLQPLRKRDNILLLPHGERCHAAGDHRCVVSYGVRWKREAAAALASMGIPAPAAVLADIDGMTELTLLTQGERP